jgi:predicted Zn-dependent peptidase
LFEDTGSVTVSAGVEIKKAPAAISVILKELSKIQRLGVREGELRRAKDYFLSQLSMALEDTLDHALWLGERMLYSDKLPDLDEIRRGVEAVTPAQVQDVARRLFTTEGLNLSLIGPIASKMQKRIEKDFEIPGR